MSDKIKYTLTKIKDVNNFYDIQVDINQLDPYSDEQALYISTKENAITKDGKLLYYISDDGYVNENIDAMGFEGEEAKRFKEAAAKFNFPEVKYTPDHDEIYCYAAKADFDQAIKQMTQIITKIYRQLDINFVNRSSKK